MADVISLFGGNVDDINPNAVHGEGLVTKDFNKDDVINGFLERKNDFDEVVIIASAKNGHFYFAASSGDIRQTLYDIESAKHMLMNYGSQFHPAEGDFD